MSRPLRCLSLKQIEPQDLARWRRLAECAAEPNPFQEPEFLLPLASRGMIPADVQLLVVPSDGDDEWLAAAVVRNMPPTLMRPLRRLRSVRTLHAYLDHPLIDLRQPAVAAERLISALADCRLGHGLRLHMLHLDGPAAQALSSAAQSIQAQPFHERLWRRAEYRRADLSVDPLQACSKARRKSLRRAFRALEQRGAVDFRLRRPQHGGDDSFYRFLDLEHRTWKGGEGTSLLADSVEVVCFREVMGGFAARGDVIFGELWVGDHVAAMTCNLLRGETLFAFKVGWDPAYADGSPGMWSDLLLPAAVLQAFPQVQQIDSCSQAGSHLESLWPSMRRMSDVVYAWSPQATWLAALRQRLRHWRSRWMAGRRPTSPQSTAMASIQNFAAAGESA